MIQIRTIHIEEFRGIRSLNLVLDAENFGIHGPNGSGKSGVVDALEFCITGDITRLSGPGSAELSVKAHAPHIDQQMHPEKACVTITADIPSLKRTVKIHRSVKNPSKAEITPDEEEVRRVIEELQLHPEFALSRREIVKYIMTPPGQRSEDVQNLLRLKHIEKLRKSLITFTNKRKSEMEAVERAHTSTEADLNIILEIDRFQPAVLLEKVNEKRGILGLENLTELTSDVSFKTGVTVPPDDHKEPALSKISALADISALQLEMTDGEPDELDEPRGTALAALESLKADEETLEQVRRHGFIKMGLDLTTKDACPLCDTEWKAEELKGYLRKKLQTAEKTGQILEQLQKDINSILKPLSHRIKLIERIIQYCPKLAPPVVQTNLSSYLKELETAETTLIDFQSDYEDIDSTIKAVSSSWWLPGVEQQVVIEDCHKGINALPDKSIEEEAREFLILAQERFEKLLKSSVTAEEQKVRNEIAQKVIKHYNNSSTKVLEDIYDNVAAEFTKLYRAINRDDEGSFVGKLVPAPAKLNFDVDFYGRGEFPPGAYHSEGHQDGMGLCLYLALMKHTLGDNFTFAVLDDVLMSVDTGHRKEVCRLLKKEFPKTQFILTTHDRVWLQYMKTERLITKSKSFAGWTVDSGPRVWSDKDIWVEIQLALDKGDVSAASALLRRYLEYTSPILADNFRARIEFRGNHHYDLEDLLPHALKKWRERLEEGIKSATHWKRDGVKEMLTTKHAKAKELIASSNTERWMINPTLHYNEWANLQPQEFQAVVDAFRELLESLRCENQNCMSYLYVIPAKGNAEELRCNCGDSSINLRAKA